MSKSSQWRLVVFSASLDVRTSRVIDDDKDVLFDRLAHSDEVKQLVWRHAWAVKA